MILSSKCAAAAVALTGWGLLAAEPLPPEPRWDDLPKTAGLHTLVKRSADAKLPAKKDGALVGRDLLMPALWALGHGQLRPRKPGDGPGGTEFLFDQKGRIFVLVRWPEESQKQALRELARVDGAVYTPKYEIRHREDDPSGHLPGDYRQLDEGKMVVQRGCWVHPKKLLELMDHPIIRYIMLSKPRS